MPVLALQRAGKNGKKRGQTTFSTFYRIALMLKKVVCPCFPRIYRRDPSKTESFCFQHFLLSL
jgi:hypothetical protein